MSELLSVQTLRCLNFSVHFILELCNSLCNCNRKNCDIFVGLFSLTFILLNYFSCTSHQMGNPLTSGQKYTSNLDSTRPKKTLRFPILQKSACYSPVWNCSTLTLHRVSSQILSNFEGVNAEFYFPKQNFHCEISWKFKRNRPHDYV